MKLLTVAEATAKLAEYPKLVQMCVEIVDQGYCGTCTRKGYKYEVTTASFEHEMGHATAKILGIEQELGEMVAALPNATSITNENPYCYPAQHLAGLAGHNDRKTAMGEYAAEAIRNYTEGAELPEDIREYIRSKMA